MIEINSKAVEFFHERTKKHIDRVVDNGKYLYDCISFNAEEDSLFKVYLQNLPTYEKLVERLEKHDYTKFLPTMVEGYILINEHYQNNLPYSEEQAKIARDASEYHITHERHHPEFFIHTDQYSINEMDTLDLLEMVCDLHAMSQELGGTTKEYFNNNHSKKFNFNNVQLRYIEELLEILEPTME